MYYRSIEAVLQLTANSLQHTATHCNRLMRGITLHHTANTLQHSQTTLKHTETHCNTHLVLQIYWGPKDCCEKFCYCVSAHHNTLQHAATSCNILQHTQHTATHCNTLKTAATTLVTTWVHSLCVACREQCVANCTTVCVVYCSVFQCMYCVAVCCSV